jgi:hypothetical protein
MRSKRQAPARSEKFREQGRNNEEITTKGAIGHDNHGRGNIPK